MSLTLVTLSLMSATAVFSVQAQQTYTPDQLTAKLIKKYASIKSAKATVRFTAYGDKKTLTCLSEIVYLSPNKIHALIKSKPVAGDWTFVSDGKRLKTTGRTGDSGKNGVTPFALQSIQDDGPPVYKETLLLWDAKRQFSKGPGGRLKDVRLRVRKGNWKGKSWLTLEENWKEEQHFIYYIDPSTFLIKRTTMQWLGASKINYEYVVEKLELNPKVNEKLFIIRP